MLAGMTNNPQVVPSRGSKPLPRAALVGALASVLLSACGPTGAPESAPTPSPSATQAQALGAPVISPELSTRTGYVPPWVSQIMPVVAASQDKYLVVWTEVWTQSSPATVDVYGVRVNASTGALLDSQPILIAQGATDQVFPSVASDGTDFLVVWNQINSAPQVYGTRVRGSDGALLNPPRLLSVPPPNPYGATPQLNPAVSFDGTNYLVVFNGYHYQNGTMNWAVLGSWVRPSDGQMVDPVSFPISSRTSSNPRVAFGGGRHLVVWSDNSTSQSTNVYGVRIDAASRQVLDTTPRSIAVSASAEQDPAVASDGSNFLVVWSGPNGLLQKTRVRGTDGLLLDAPTTAAQASVKPADVTFDGQDYRVAWVGKQDNVLKAFSTRVSTGGGTLGELLLSSVDATNDPERPGIAATAPGRFLELYTQYDSMDRIRMRLVQDEHPTECNNGQPSLVLNGPALLTLECTQGGLYSDPGAQAFDGCGNAIQVHSYNAGNDSSGPGPNVGAEGTYDISYAAWDAMGNTVNAARTVIVDDRTAPTLKLKGAATMTHTCGSQWVDPGVEAMDACYGNIAHTVWRTGEVNGWAAGTYTVTYSLTDSGGNSAPSVTRTVQVANCPW